MGFEDTVAGSRQAYVETALSLANDHLRAEAVRTEIAQRSERLFDSTAAVAEHAMFFERAVEAAIEGGSADD